MQIYFEHELGYVVVDVATKQIVDIFPTYEAAVEFVAKGGK